MIYRFDAYQLDTDLRELKSGVGLVPVEPQVFDLLLFLVRNRTQVVTKDQLIAAVWKGRIVSESTLSSRVAAVRRAIGDSGDKQRLVRTFARKGLRFVGDVRETPPTSLPGQTGADCNSALHGSPPAQSLPDRPSIAVLPFVNMSGDPSDDHLCDGVTEDIITELTRFSELFVIARNSSFQYKGRSVDVRQIGRELGVRYVLEGSIRHSGKDLRLTGQLVDTTTGAHRWAERYDRKLEDVFALQDELARTIATILAAHVNKAEAEHALCKPPASWQAHDYFLRASAVMASYWSSMDVESIYQTRRFLELCLLSDPNYARAAALLSCTHLTAYLNPLDQDFRNPAACSRAYELARNAVRLDPNLPFTRTHLGIVLACRQEHDAAIAEFEHAIALDANFCHLYFALALILAGDPARALEVVRSHMRLDPFYTPQAPCFMGMALYMLKQYTQAIAPLREGLLRAPRFLGSLSTLAAAYAQLGQLDKAHAYAAEIRHIRPQYKAERGRGFLGMYKNAEDAEHFLDGYHKAGLT